MGMVSGDAESVASTNRAVTIVTPTQRLAAALRRTMPAAEARIICIGRSAEAVVRWAETIGPAPGFFIWVGEADALRATMTPGMVALIASVSAHDGRRFAAPLARLHDRGERIVRSSVVTPENLPTDATTRRGLAERSGAELADGECALFAEAATLFGWRWAAILMVRHDVEARLPSRIDRFDDLRGRPRIGTRLLSLLAEPRRTMRALARSKPNREAITAIPALVERLRSGAAEDAPVDEVAAR